MGVWKQYVQHDFVKQLGQGTLSRERFIHFLKCATTVIVPAGLLLLTPVLIGRIISTSNITPVQTGMAVSASKAQPDSVLSAEICGFYSQSPDRQIFYVC